MAQTRPMVAWRLPWSLRLEGSLSGAVLKASIDGASVDLHLPFAEPFPVGAAPQVLPPLAEGRAPAWPWTTTVQAVLDARGVTVFDVYRIVLVASAESAGRIDAWTGRELAVWFEKLTDWLEVWTGQVSDPAARRSQQPAVATAEGAAVAGAAPRAAVMAATEAADPRVRQARRTPSQQMAELPGRPVETAG